MNVFFLAALLFTFGGPEPVVGNGVSQTETRQVTGFTVVRNHSVLSVSVTQAPAFALTVTADANLLPVLTTTVRDGALVIEQSAPIKTNRPLSATVSLPALTGIDVTGGGKIAASGVTAGPFSIVSTGAGTVSFKGTVATLTLNATGAGAVALSGAATGLQAKIIGAGKIDGADLRVTGPADVTLSGAPSATFTVHGDSSFSTGGAGTLRLFLEGGTTNFTIVGGGNIDWSGQTTIGKVDVTGAGRVKKL
jgi:hypothetical protein